MNKTTDLLDTVKQKHALTSNYQLAKHLGISQADISHAYKGRYRSDEYTATRIALALDREPIHVIAELRAEDEKNPTKREFWRNFSTHAALVIACLTALAFGLPSTDAAGMTGNFHARMNDVSLNYAHWLLLAVIAATAALLPIASTGKSEAVRPR